MDDALKTRGIIYLNVETWMLFVPPIKISDYAPDHKQSCGWQNNGTTAYMFRVTSPI